MQLQFYGYIDIYISQNITSKCNLDIFRKKTYLDKLIGNYFLGLDMQENNWVSLCKSKN